MADETTATPTLLSVVRLSATHALLTWETNSISAAPTEQIYIWQRTLPSGTWGQVNKVPASPAQRPVYGLVVTVGYQYRIMGYGRKGGASGWSGTITIDPWQERPLSPNNVTASRDTDGSMVVEWDNRDTTDAPYKWLYIFRSVDLGAFVQINRLVMPPVGSGLDLPEAYRDFPGYDKRVAYRLWAANDAGGARFHGPQSANEWTLPSAPRSVAAAWVAAGIRVTWVLNSSTANRVDVAQLVEGGSWGGATRITGTQHIITSPGATESRRRFRVRSVHPDGSVSAWVESPWLPGSVQPLAPVPQRQLPADPAGDVVVKWQHRAGADGAGQAAYNLRHRLGSGSWMNQTGTGATSEAVLEGLSAANRGTTREWQVQTQNSAGLWSPWSALTPQQLVAPPQVGISQPVTGTPWGSTDLRVAWSVPGETSWDLLVTDDATGEVLAYRSGTRAHSGAQLFPGILSDGQDVTVRVDAMTTSGRAEQGMVSFPVVLQRPAAPGGVAQPNPSEGTVTLTAIPGAGGVEPTVRLEWVRSDDGGLTWEELGEQDPALGYLIDWTPPSKNELIYRPRAVSALPSSQLGEPIAVRVHSTDSWLNWGEGWQQRARGRKLTKSAPAGLDVEFHRFYKREGAVVFRGQKVLPTWAITITLPTVTAADDMARWAEGAKQDDTLCVLRDSTGMRLVGQVHAFNMAHTEAGFQTVTFNFTELPVP